MFVSFNFLLPLLSAVATVSGTALPPHSRRVLHERRDTVPHGWALHRRADPDTVLPLNIALRQSNLDKLDAYLLDVADPESPNYGKHWTAAQVAQTFRPSKESMQTVHAWLLEEGMDASRLRFSKDRGYMHMNVTVAEAERLLAADYYVYRHAESGIEHVGCHSGYHLPEHLVAHVDMVTPTVEFGGVSLGARVAKRASGAPPGATGGQMKRPVAPKTPIPAAVRDVLTDADHCDTQVTLDCIRALYDFQPNLQATDQNTVGVVELADQTLSPSDLTTFFQKFATDSVNTQPTLVSIDGGTINADETDPNLIGESNLDFELMMGLLGKNQEVKLYQVGGSISFNLLLDAIDDVNGGFCGFDGGDDPTFDFVDSGTTEDCGNKPSAFVYSVSYAGGEDFPAQYMQRQCTEYGKLGLLGMTFFYASGDNGVASNADNLCLQADGSTAAGSGNFLPNFPATCPYVTAVGATQVDAGKSVTDPEIAPSQFGSGGGFSNVFDRPDFQSRAVTTYLDNFAPDLGADVFNRNGRGVPDISANGFPTAVVINGQWTLSGGTSASTPIIAAMIAAVNDARLAAGKSTVGYINPALYSNMFVSVFHDIVSGSNPGCGTSGFPTAPGWDPVTGLGTPNFPMLLDRFMMLP
ncbi:subtilisin-like protein [Daedaleopsis nitida]|nr:subtilisin-like protein [Daedaleopsis nitida]